MSIVNTNYNIINNKFDTHLNVRKEKDNSETVPDAGQDISNNTVSAANENAASSNVKNAQMASEIAFFSRLQAISGIEGYGNLKSGNTAAEIIPISFPRFDRTF